MDPLIENLDIREKGISMLSEMDKRCNQCGYLNNFNAFHCYNCENLLGSFGYNYKRGNQTYGSKEVRKFDDEYNKSYKDFIQPTRWNNVTRKIETNPEFVKNYGDPWKQTDDNPSNNLIKPK